ncbi:MAG: sigma-70 family RNA polymerase sigma factor [Thermoleophilia bacterium]
MEESFHTTLEAARLGAEWAWTAIYRDVAPGVLRYLRARAAAEPEDLLGGVFLEVVRALPRFTGGHSEFRAWVFTIAHHRLVDDVRWRRRRPVATTSCEDLVAAVPLGNGEDDALHPLVTKEVCRLLDHLAPDQRDVLLLRVLAGLSIVETADVLGKRPGAVKSLQVRGLAALRRALSSEAVSFAALPTITEMR